MKYSIHQIDANAAEKACREITISLPEYFGIKEANERYANGVRKHLTFGAMADGACIGMLTCEIPFPNNANIYWMAVAKKYHGHGIGRSLMQFTEDYCLAKGCVSMTVETLSSTENDLNYLKTYNFYRKVGFQPLETVHKPWFVDSLLFELNTYSSDFKMVYLYKFLKKKNLK